MALRTFVKISEVNNLSDARYCAGMGVDLIGFCLDPTNPKAVTPEQFTEITGWIAGVKLVGEFYESSALIIKELLDSYPVNYVQISNIQELDYLSTINIPVILNVDLSRLEEPEHLIKSVEESASRVAYFLLTNGGQDADEEIYDKFLQEINHITKDHQVLLGFAISAENVMSKITDTSIAGIALQGGDEIKPGYKDYDELADILEALEIDDME